MDLASHILLPNHYQLNRVRSVHFYYYSSWGSFGPLAETNNDLSQLIDDWIVDHS